MIEAFGAILLAVRLVANTTHKIVQPQKFQEEVAMKNIYAARSTKDK
jgi:hypothetical protein